MRIKQAYGYHQLLVTNSNLEGTAGRLYWKEDQVGNAATLSAWSTVTVFIPHLTVAAPLKATPGFWDQVWPWAILLTTISL